MESVQVYRDPKTGKLAYKLPRKGARWHKNLATMDDLMKLAVAEQPAPFIIDYVDTMEGT